jgi:hypothetical protein
MRFTVPKFIDEEPKIVGPLTFKQFLYIGGAAGLCVILYFVLPLSIFIIAAVILLGGSVALAFLKIENYSIPSLLKNFFFFSVSSKIYLWKKTMLLPKMIRKEKPKKTKEKKLETESPLKIGGKSQLKNLASYLETGKQK